MYHPEEKSVTKAIPRPIPALFDPLDDKIALQVFKVDMITEAGLELPETYADSYFTPISRVIAVGPNVKQVKPGDYVLVLGQAPGYKVRHGGYEYMMFHEAHVEGIIKDKEVIEKLVGAEPPTPGPTAPKQKILT